MGLLPHPVQVERGSGSDNVGQEGQSTKETWEQGQARCLETFCEAW